jgi:hypothetical protein
MNSQQTRKRRAEREVLDELLQRCPEFCQVPSQSWNADNPDPPDFVGDRQDGQRIGLELGEWLDSQAATSSIGRRKMQRDLLAVLHEKVDGSPNPKPTSFQLVYVTPHWGRKIASKDRTALRNEFHDVCKRIGQDWESIRRPTYGWPLSGERREEAICCARNGWRLDVARYFPSWRTLGKYVAALRFRAKGPRISRCGLSWIQFDAEGGTPNPKAALRALCKLIGDKAKTYARETSRLSKTQVDQLVLLIHSGPGRAILNRPWELDFPDLCDNLRSIVEEVNAVAKRSPFDSIWLLQRSLDAQDRAADCWVAQVYPAESLHVLNHGPAAPNPAERAGQLDVCSC